MHRFPKDVKSYSVFFIQGFKSKCFISELSKIVTNADQIKVIPVLYKIGRLVKRPGTKFTDKVLFSGVQTLVLIQRV